MRMWWKAEREREWSPGWDCPRIPDRRPPPPPCMEISYLQQTSGWKGQQAMLHWRKGRNNIIWRKPSLICYFTKIGKGQMWCIWYCLSSNNLAFLRNSISIIGFGQLWCTQNTLIADGYPHRMPKNQYFFLSFSFGKQFPIFKKASSYF